MVYSDKIKNILKEHLSNAKLTNIEYPTAYFQVNFADINIVYMTDKNGRREAFLRTHQGKENKVNSEYTAIWKQYAPGKFMCKDFIKDIRDENRTPYYSTEFTYDEIKYKVLLRKLIEIDNPKLSDSDRQRIGHEYSDIVIDNVHYSVIKIKEIEDEEDTTWMTYDGCWKLDVYHDNFIDVVWSIEKSELKKKKKEAEEL